MLLRLFVLALSSLAIAKSTIPPYEQLKALAAASPDGIIKLDEQTWDLITSPKRDWSAVVQLTALGQTLKCIPCREFDPAFRTVAKAWLTVPKEQREKHFFASLDFHDGQGVFRKLGLASAPVVTVYPATQGPNKLSSGRTEQFNYDFSTYGSDAKELSNQLSAYTPVPIPYRAPIRWDLVGSAITTIVMLGLSARLLLPVLTNRWLWSTITIMTILVMTSGFMFVRIRGMPYRTVEQAISPGFQSQYGAEIWMVATKYFLLSAMFIILTQGIPLQDKPSLQKPAIYLCTIAIVMLFSALIKDFKVKNGGYPFSYVF